MLRVVVEGWKAIPAILLIKPRSEFVAVISDHQRYDHDMINDQSLTYF